MANLLANEKSVYLKQHAHNPVDWRPWGDEAFAEAARRKCPVLVSIGYSTCHWCHVMERESFESPVVAQALNADFVAIKVDREELPDVDAFFMEALLMFSGRGGWPLNMFVTPDRKPFYGGTYFPQHVFLQLMGQIAKIWHDEPKKIEEQARHFMEHLGGGENGIRVQSTGTSLEDARALRNSALKLMSEAELRRFDPVWGGFGQAPKFPRSHELSALLRAREQAPLGQRNSLDFAVQHTLKCMAYGGLRDHLEGGFHRYSTDERWLVPHFEKMLYDQALLITAYSEAWASFKEPFYADIVMQTLDFLDAKMCLPSGLFGAAWDADSEGVEGKFYIFSFDEVKSTIAFLPIAEQDAFLKAHGVEKGGNWEGSNVLAAPPETAWSELQQKSFQQARAKLLELRNKRTPPIFDDKAIVSWNAWMISGLFKAGINLAGHVDASLSERLIAAGKKTLSALIGACKVDGEFKLPRILYGHDRQGQGYLEDHAALIEALQYGALATHDESLWHDAAKLLAQTQARFVDSEGRISANVVGSSRTSKVDEQDGANPAALSIFVPAIYRQALFDANNSLEEQGSRFLASLKPLLEKFPNALSYLLAELAVIDAKLWRAPQPAKILSELSKEGRWAGSVLTAQAPSDEFEACDFVSCFLKTRNEDELFATLNRNDA